MPAKLFLLERIRRDGGTQPRTGLDQNTVDQYARDMRESDYSFPPVVVFHDGEAYWLADGFHRVAAAEQIGLELISANVQQGTRRDAVLYSVSANAKHGLRRSPDDMRRAVETLLRDPEWTLWSDAEIARQCVVSRDFVAAARAEMGASTLAAAASVEALPAEIREKVEAIKADGGTPKVYNAKGGKTTVMDTSKIGKKIKLNPPITGDLMKKRELLLKEFDQSNVLEKNDFETVHAPRLASEYGVSVEFVLECAKWHDVLQVFERQDNHIWSHFRRFGLTSVIQETAFYLELEESFVWGVWDSLNQDLQREWDVRKRVPSLAEKTLTAPITLPEVSEPTVLRECTPEPLPLPGVPTGMLAKLPTAMVEDLYALFRGDRAPRRQPFAWGDGSFISEVSWVEGFVSPQLMRSISGFFHPGGKTTELQWERSRLILRGLAVPELEWSATNEKGSPVGQRVTLVGLPLVDTVRELCGIPDPGVLNLRQILEELVVLRRLVKSARSVEQIHDPAA